jgi:hypothetical protein
VDTLISEARAATHRRPLDLQIQHQRLFQPLYEITYDLLMIPMIQEAVHHNHSLRRRGIQFFSIPDSIIVINIRHRESGSVKFQSLTTSESDS